MLHKQYNSLRLSSVLSIFLIIPGSTYLQAQLPPPPKANAIVIGGGQVVFPDSDVKNSNDKKMTAVEQSFQRELMRLRKSERLKVSPEARQRASQAYADLNIRMGYYVDNVRDAAKTDLNALNRLNFGSAANQYVTTNQVRVAKGYLPKSGDPYVDMANDTISDQIKRILAGNPGRKFTTIQLLARIVHQIDVSMKPDSVNLLANQLSVLDSHIQQLVSSGYVTKEKVKILEKVLETDDHIIFQQYLGYAYSIR